MAAMLEFIKIVFAPALISLGLYLLLTFLILPFVRRHRQRYDQYLPLHSISDTLITRTSSLRERIGYSLTAFVLPSHGRNRNVDVVDGSTRRGSINMEEGDLFGAEEADDLVGFNVRDVAQRREELRRDVAGMESASRNAALSSMPTRNHVPSG